MFETRQRFRELRTAWVCKLLITESCFAARQTFGAIPRLPGRADKKQTFRKRLRNTWNVPRGEIKRNSLKLTVSRKLWRWFMSKQAGKLLFLKNNVWLNIFNKKKVCNKFDTKDCNKFDKVILRNSWRHIMVPDTHCQSGRLNILEDVDYNIFFTLTGVWYRSFSRLSF